MLNRTDSSITNSACIKYVILIVLCISTSLAATEHKVPFGLIVDSSEYTVCPDFASIDSLTFEYKFDEAVQLAQTILSERPDWQIELLLNKRIGFTFYQNGYYDSAKVYFQKYYSTADDHPNEMEKGHALYYLGLNEIELGARNKAEENLLKALAIYKSLESIELYWQLYPLTTLAYHSRMFADMNTMNDYMLRCDSIMQQEPDISDYLRYKYLLHKGSFERMPDRCLTTDSVIQQAISIAENKLDAISMCDIYLSYCGLHVFMGNDDLNEAYSRKALKTAAPVLRPDHPVIGYSLLFLAQAHQHTHNYKAASENIEQAEEIIIRAFGKTHLVYARLLQIKSGLFLDMRISDKAIEGCEEMVLILSQQYGTDSPLAMDALFDLAVVYTSFAEYEKGITLFRKYRNYLEDTNGTLSTGYILSSQYLAYAYQMSDKNEEAYELLLSIKSDILQFYGEDHPEYGNYQLFNGMVSYALGYYDQSEQHFLAAKDVFSKNLLPHHPQISAVRNLLAICYGSAKDYDASLDMFRELLLHRNSFLELVYSYSSAEQKIQYLQTHRVLIDEVYSLALRSHNQDIKNFAYEMLLRGKSVALDALTSENKLGQCSADDSVVNIYEKLIAIADDISTVTYANHSPDSLDSVNRQLQSLIDEKDRLEYKLSSLCSDYSDIFTLRKTTIRDVREKLPENTILLEYALFDPYLFDSEGSVRSRFEQSHYALFVLDNTNDVQMFDIGVASDIDSLIEEVRNSLQTNQLDAYTEKSQRLEQQLKEKTKILYQVLIEPVRELIGGGSAIYLATDGLLNVLPFDILPNSDSTYLIEEYELSYITSGRDIVKYDDHFAQPSSMTIYYNPDFSQYSAVQLAVAETDTMLETAVNRGADNCLQHKFSELPLTVQEVSAITSLIDTVLPSGSIDLYSREFASEDKVKSQTDNLDIVHFATHGFICSDDEEKQARDYHSLLLYSGIALSGANGVMEALSGRDDVAGDGILSGYEIARLDLIGTKLVTLSACETALGESLAGEGVFGLRRAFHQAGAESILMSLWKVPDQLCANLIPRFYNNWINKRFTKAKSLREASLDLLKQSRDKYNSGYPLLWSGFIIEGNTK